MSEIKGYVVRGKWSDGQDVYAYWWDAIRGVHWTVDRDAVPKDAVLPFATLGKAIEAKFKSSHLADVRIFAVAPDGTETPLPTYEEALSALAMVRDAAETALRAHGARGMGGAPSELEGCPPGALRALLRLLGGAR